VGWNDGSRLRSRSGFGRNAPVLWFRLWLRLWFGWWISLRPGLRFHLWLDLWLGLGNCNWLGWQLNVLMGSTRHGWGSSVEKWKWLVLYPADIHQAQLHAKGVQCGVEFHSLLTLYVLDVVSKTEHIHNRIARLCHLQHILCWNKSRGIGSVVSGGTVEGNPIRHYMAVVSFL
jgi:hypothetical protein